MCLWKQGGSLLGVHPNTNCILPGQDKIQALKDFPEPITLHQIRGFIGLCNFFRGQVENFSLFASPLTHPTQNDLGYQASLTGATGFPATKAGAHRGACPAFPLPLSWKPIHQKTAVGDCSALSYASSTMTTCVRSSPMLLGNFRIMNLGTHPSCSMEVAAAIGGLEQCDQYLEGLPFILFMDQRPKMDLSHLHKKTLVPFAGNMDRYSFTIQPKSAFGSSTSPKKSLSGTGGGGSITATKE